jgi:hypothetical protein
MLKHGQNQSYQLFITLPPHMLVIDRQRRVPRWTHCIRCSLRHPRNHQGRQLGVKVPLVTIRARRTTTTLSIWRWSIPNIEMSLIQVRSRRWRRRNWYLLIAAGPSNNKLRKWPCLRRRHMRSFIGTCVVLTWTWRQRREVQLVIWWWSITAVIAEGILMGRSAV